VDAFAVGSAIPAPQFVASLLVEPPETRHARSGDVHIAYQVTGEGPFDLVYVPPFVSHVELAWQVPSNVRLIERLSSFSRLIRFDKRGNGMSDRVEGVPTLETRMDEARQPSAYETAATISSLRLAKPRRNSARSALKRSTSARYSSLRPCCS
jgi:hypothetical protein